MSPPLEAEPGVVTELDLWRVAIGGLCGFWCLWCWLLVADVETVDGEAASDTVEEKRNIHRNLITQRLTAFVKVNFINSS